MDHLDAEQLKAVERYMLGDLSVSEVEEFERHFFDCPQCSEELRALTMFQENARAVFIEQDAAVIVPPSVHVPESTSWWQRFSPHMFSLGAAMACLLIGIFAGRSMIAPREVLDAGVEAGGESLLLAQVRGEQDNIVSAVRGEAFGMFFDPSWDGDYKLYRAVLVDASGKDRFSKSLKPVLAPGAIHTWFPSKGLSEGKYTLVMFGITSQSGKDIEVARLPFSLKFQ